MNVHVFMFAKTLPQFRSISIIVFVYCAILNEKLTYCTL